MRLAVVRGQSRGGLFCFCWWQADLPKWKPVVQSNLYCLDPRGLFFVGGKRNCPNRMPTFLKFDVLQGSRDLGCVRLDLVRM